MSSYRFRLENVMMVRKIKHSAALADLARASRTVAEHADRERIARELYDAARVPIGAVSGETFVAMREQKERLGANVELAANELQAVSAERERARSHAVETDREVKALERLDERLRERWLAEVARKESAELDDIATAAFARATLEGAR